MAISIKSLPSTIIFAIVFIFCNNSSWFESTFGEPFKVKRSSLHDMKGDLYGICAPIEHLRDLNKKKFNQSWRNLWRHPFSITTKLTWRENVPFGRNNACVTMNNVRCVNVLQIKCLNFGKNRSSMLLTTLSILAQALSNNKILLAPHSSPVSNPWLTAHKTKKSGALMTDKRMSP